MNKLLCTAALALALAGCDSGPNTTAADETIIYTLTIVELHGEEPPTVVESTISRAEQMRESAGVGAIQSAISKQLTCVPQDLQMFDHTNFTGNEICFRGAGTATLSSYSRGKGVTWSSATHSYRSGESPGYFTDQSNNNHFFTYYESDSMGTAASGSKSVTLDAPADLSGVDLTGGGDMGGGGGSGGEGR